MSNQEIIVGGLIIGGVILLGPGPVKDLVKAGAEVAQNAAEVLSFVVSNGIKFAHFFGTLLIDEFGVIVKVISYFFYRLEGLFTHDSDTALSALYGESVNDITDPASQKKGWQVRNWALCMGLPYHYIDIGGQKAKDNISVIRRLAKKAAARNQWVYTFLIAAPYDDYVKIVREGVNKRSFISPYYARRDKFNGIFSVLDTDVYNKFNDFQPIDKFYLQFYQEYRNQSTKAFDYMHEVNSLIGQLSGSVSSATRYCLADAANGMIQDMKYIYENHSLPSGIQRYESLELQRPPTNVFEAQFKLNYEELLNLYNLHHLGVLPPDRMGENTINIIERDSLSERGRIERLDQILIDAHLSTERDRQWGAYYQYVGRGGIYPPIGRDGLYDYSLYPDIYPRLLRGQVTPDFFVFPPPRTAKVEQEIMKARRTNYLPDSLTNTDLREFLTINQIYQLDYYSIQVNNNNIFIDSRVNTEIKKRDIAEQIKEYKNSSKVALLM